MILKRKVTSHTRCRLCCLWAPPRTLTLVQTKQCFEWFSWGGARQVTPGMCPALHIPPLVEVWVWGGFFFLTKRDVSKLRAALFTIAQTWKQPKCPSTEEWIRKMWYMYTLEYYSAIKKNEIMSFAATWRDLEMIILSEVSQRKTNVI